MNPVPTGAQAQVLARRPPRDSIDTPDRAESREIVAKRGYIGEIDGLRCFAMTGVVAAHCKLLPIGWAGVWLFFVISGFVVTKTLCERRATEKRPLQIFGNFIARRVLRIWPIYFVYIAAVILVLLYIGRTIDWYGIGAMSTFTFNFYLIEDGRASPSGHLWTISVEEQFYVIFGLLFSYLNRLSLARVLWFIAAMGIPVRMAATVYYQAHLMGENDQGFAVYANSFCHFDAFCIGSLIALNADAVAANRLKVNAFAVAAAAVLVAYCFVYFGVNKFVLGKDGADVFKHVVTGVLFGQWREVFLYSAADIVAAALICLILVGNPVVIAMSGGAIQRWIGKISYGAYVYHIGAGLAAHQILVRLGVLQTSDTVFAYLMVFALTYPLCLMVAYLSYHYFESRFLEYRHLF
jgi:peptidoglycan/LPS O-acetylase OafA/YrhL